MLEHSGHKERDLPNLGLQTLRRGKKRLDLGNILLAGFSSSTTFERRASWTSSTAPASMDVSNSSGIYENPQQLNHHQGPAEHLHAVEGEPSQMKKSKKSFEEETSKSF
jgi:hypothetical protein